MILVTGGAGFIGRRVCAALTRRGARVRVLDDLSNSTGAGLPEGTELVIGDVRSASAVAAAATDATCIVHLAAIASVPACEAAPGLASEVNVLGALNARWAAQAASARLVFASSAAVYPASPYPLGEGTPTSAASLYAASKVLGEALTLTYPNSVALRLFNIYDELDGDGVIARWNRAAAAGEPLVLRGDGTQTRDYVHVLDAAEVIASAASRPLPARVLNVCTGVATSLLEVLAQVGRRASLQVAHAERQPGDLDCSIGDPTLLRQVMPSARLRGFGTVPA